MRYMTLIYEYAGGVEGLSEGQHQALLEKHRRLQQCAREDGAYLGASELKPAATAVCVRMKNGVASLSDGPFVESKELFVGFYLLECADLDAALRLAAMIPTASHSGVEVRPLDADCGYEGPGQSAEALGREGGKSLFALLNYLDEDFIAACSPGDMQALVDSSLSMVRRAEAAGDYVTGSKLMPAATATTISHAGDTQRVVDGPFSEAKEVLLGFHVLACESITAATDYAKGLPEVGIGAVEVRPINYYAQTAPQWLEWNSSALS